MSTSLESPPIVAVADVRREAKSAPVAGYHPLVIALTAVAAGMVVDRYRPLPVAVWWAIAAAGLGGWFMLWRRRQNKVASVILLLAGLALAASWHHCRWNLFGGDDLGLFARSQQQPVCIEAVALQTPRVIPTGGVQSAGFVATGRGSPLRGGTEGDSRRRRVAHRLRSRGDARRGFGSRSGGGRSLPGLRPSLAAGACPEPGRARSRGTGSRPPRHQPSAGELSGRDFRGIDGFHVRPHAAAGIVAAPRPAGFREISQSATGEPGGGRPAGPPRTGRSRKRSRPSNSPARCTCW